MNKNEIFANWLKSSYNCDFENTFLKIQLHFVVQDIVENITNYQCSGSFNHLDNIDEIVDEIAFYIFDNREVFLKSLESLTKKNAFLVYFATVIKSKFISIRKKNNKIKCQSGGSSQEEQIVVDFK